MPTTNKAVATVYKLNRIINNPKARYNKKVALNRIFKKHSLGDQIIEIVNHGLRILQYEDKIDELFLEGKKAAIEDMLTLDTLLQQFEKSSIRIQKKNTKNKGIHNGTDVK